MAASTAVNLTAVHLKVRQDPVLFYLWPHGALVYVLDEYKGGRWEAPRLLLQAHIGRESCRLSGHSLRRRSLNAGSEEQQTKE